MGYRGYLRFVQVSAIVTFKLRGGEGLHPWNCLACLFLSCFSWVCAGVPSAGIFGVSFFVHSMEVMADWGVEFCRSTPNGFWMSNDDRNSHSETFEVKETDKVMRMNESLREVLLPVLADDSEHSLTLSSAVALPKRRADNMT